MQCWSVRVFLSLLHTANHRNMKIRYDRDIGNYLRTRGAYARVAIPGYGEVVIVPTSISSENRTPCSHCIFERWSDDMDSRYCPYMMSCIATKRDDGVSVKFVKKAFYENRQ